MELSLLPKAGKSGTWLGGRDPHAATRPFAHLYASSLFGNSVAVRGRLPNPLVLVMTLSMARWRISQIKLYGHQGDGDLKMGPHHIDIRHAATHKSVIHRRRSTGSTHAGWDRRAMDRNRER